MTTNTSLVKSIPGSSTAPSFSRSVPFPILVQLARVQKLESEMATLLHHIQPWMHRSIAEAEERLERKMAQHTERKIAEIHQRLDAFKLWVLARPAPQVDMSTLQAAVESLLADVDMILEARVPKSEAPSAELAEDVVLAALFATYENPPPAPQDHAKRRRGREEDEARVMKKEHREIEAARRASFGDDKARKIRAIELATGASSSRDVETARGKIDSSIGDEDTTEGVKTT